MLIQFIVMIILRRGNQKDRQLGSVPHIDRHIRHLAGCFPRTRIRGQMPKISHKKACYV